MNFQIEPDPAHPLGGYALLILPEGASVGSGRMVLRRRYDDRHLGPGGWQAAPVSLGPFAASPRGGGLAVSLGPQVVAHLEEFDALEIAFEGGDAGSAVWPENVLLPPDAAAAGGLRHEAGSAAESAGAARVGTAPLPDLAAGGRAEPPLEVPAKPAPAPEPEPETPPPPPPDTPTKSRKGLLIGLAIAALAVVAALAFVDLDRLRDGMFPGEEGHEDCSDAAFAADREGDPAARLERVRRCAGVAGVSPETRLAVVESLLGQLPDARVVMGRWYDPAHREADHSPFDAPAIETAARYYFEAREAGAADAEALLRDVCGRLDADDLMQGNAIHLYCSAR